MTSYTFDLPLRSISLKNSPSLLKAALLSVCTSSRRSCRWRLFWVPTKNVLTKNGMWYGHKIATYVSCNINSCLTLTYGNVNHNILVGPYFLKRRKRIYTIFFTTSDQSRCFTEHQLRYSLALNLSCHRLWLSRLYNIILISNIVTLGFMFVC